MDEVQQNNYTECSRNFPLSRKSEFQYCAQGSPNKLTNMEPPGRILSQRAMTLYYNNWVH